MFDEASNERQTNQRTELMAYFRLLALMWKHIICGTLTNEVHCTRITPIQGSAANMDDSGKRIQEISTTVADLTLKETLCLNFSDGMRTQIHTIEYVRMEQQFPVSASYKFGIPLITTSCICDCAGAEQYCSVDDYKYNSGCLMSSKSEVCCEVAIEPCDGKTYTAVKLTQPDTIIILRHRIYERLASRWTEAASEEFEAVVNKGSAKMETIDKRQMEIRTTTGRVIREMLNGMYYFSNDNRQLMMGVRLNEPTESDIHKLGWLRKNANSWLIRNGIIKITDSQHVTIENCKGQRYLTRYNAEYFITSDDRVTDLDLGYPVNEQNWIEQVEILNDNRAVRIVHAEGTVIHISVSSDTRPIIVRHASHLLTFNGTIRMDDQSNRFLNLTILGGKGTLIGYVHRSEDKSSTDWSFSIEIGTATRTKFTATIGGIPTGIISDRYVCLQPAGDAGAEQCKWLKYEASPLRERHMAHRWQAGIDNCPGCNERGIENFLLNLDPRQWFNGLNSTTEAVTCALEIALIIVSILATVLICTKCIIPLAKCTISLSKPPKK
uniref:Phlebovirus glycoprotein G2 fusion domain-containing protein n=2 Tax=Wuchereria bancrofti TaxID=6293 RepID=A0A1I8EAZ1_WUCBA